MPTIGLWVNEEVWNAWRLLNSADNIATKELKKALYQILEKHRDDIEKMREAEKRGDTMLSVIDILSSVSEEEVLGEIDV